VTTSSGFFCLLLSSKPSTVRSSRRNRLGGTRGGRARLLRKSGLVEKARVETQSEFGASRNFLGRSQLVGVAENITPKRADRRASSESGNSNFAISSSTKASWSRSRKQQVFELWGCTVERTKFHPRLVPAFWV
jgi:hypothetical protein